MQRIRDILQSVLGDREGRQRSDSQPGRSGLGVHGSPDDQACGPTPASCTNPENGVAWVGVNHQNQHCGNFHVTVNQKPIFADVLVMKVDAPSRLIGNTGGDGGDGPVPDGNRDLESRPRKKHKSRPRADSEETLVLGESPRASSSPSWELPSNASPEPTLPTNGAAMRFRRSQRLNSETIALAEGSG